MRKLIIATFLSLAFCQLSAQTQHHNAGWLMMVNNTKFNSKLGMQFDFQLRSSDQWDHVRNVLIRPGLTYFINDKQNLTLGYLFQNTFIPNGSFSSINLHEQRIFEQYVYAHKIKSIFASHRVRLEQRFIERNGNPDLFAQRFRYFIRLIQPLQKAQPAFTKGAFVALQNEFFLNVQNKDQLNKNIFDQNRAYLALGYRFSKQLDVEAGYLNQTIKGISHNTINNVVQFALYTRF